jgi:putative nucleotidyltransferase with HDIG domain
VSAPTFRKLLHSLDRRRRDFGVVTKIFWSVLVLALAYALITALGATDGVVAAAPLLLYIPVLVVAYLFEVPGGVAAAGLAGLALRPLLLHEAENSENLSTSIHLTFIAGYLIAGVACGATFRAARAWREDATKLHDSALKTFAALVGTYDAQTGTHCERVAANACTLGRELGLTDRELKQLHWAGILHDLGKVVLPSEVLLKPGKLSEAETGLVRQHASVGARLLLGVSERFKAVAEGVESHHERWDGSGYPWGLRQEEIPLFGRILTIVDVFEAITSDRPYQKASPPEKAVAILRSGAGSSFDPRLAMLYEQLYWGGRIHVFGRQSDDLRLSLSRETLWNLTKVTPAQERPNLSPQHPGVPAAPLGPNQPALQPR